MTTVSIETPFPIFTDVDGSPLDFGYIYVGQVNLSPEVNPIQLYFDEALTIPAPQPVRTSGGYPARSGTATRLYCGETDYSIMVRSSSGAVVFSAPSATAKLSGVSISVDDNDAGTKFTTIQGFVDYIQSPNGPKTIGVDPGAGATPTTFDIWVKQQVAVAENYSDLQAALNSGAPIVRLTEPNTNLAVGVTVPSGVTLEGSGKAETSVTCTANITPFTMLSANDASVEGLLIIANAAQTAPMILLDAASSTMARCRVRDVQGSGLVTDFPFISVRTRNGAYGSWAHEFDDISVSGCGTILKCETQFADSWINSLKVSHVYANDFIRGFHAIATAGDGCSDSTFFDWSTQTSARTQFGALISDVAVQGRNRQNSFTDVRFYDLINGGGLAYYVGENVLDTRIQGLIVDPLAGNRFIDHGISTLVNGSSPMDYLARRGRLVQIQTNSGFTPSTSGSATTSAIVNYALTRTGATAGSVARLYSTDVISGLSQNQLFNTDFGLPLKFSFSLTRIGAGASSIGRVQFKTTQADGQLAAAGLGVQINNYELFGESFGASLGVVNLGLTLTDAETYRIDILHYPGSRTEWWVNGVFKAVQGDTAKIPSGLAVCYVQQSISNVAANDVQLFTNSISVKTSEQ